MIMYTLYICIICAMLEDKTSMLVGKTSMLENKKPIVKDKGAMLEYKSSMLKNTLKHIIRLQTFFKTLYIRTS